LILDPSGALAGMSAADAEILADFMLNSHDLATETWALHELEDHHPRPQWPRHFEPVDPAELKPPAPAWAGTATTQPAATSTAPAGRSLPPPFIEPSDAGSPDNSVPPASTPARRGPS